MLNSNSSNGRSAMSNVINFRTEVDDDAVELFVSFKISLFSGEGSAWFSRANIEEFTDRLSRYPLDNELLPILAGGFLNKEGTRVIQEHVHISAKPTGNRGYVNLLIRLAEPTDDGLELKYTASANVSMSYSAASEVSTGLRALVESDLQERSFSFDLHG